MRLGDDVAYFLSPGSRPRPAKVVRKWSEHLANVVVFLDSDADGDHFGSREVVSCTAHRSQVPFVQAGGTPPTGAHFRERDDPAAG